MILTGSYKKNSVYHGSGSISEELFLMGGGHSIKIFSFSASGFHGADYQLLVQAGAYSGGNEDWLQERGKPHLTDEAVVQHGTQTNQRNHGPLYP